MSNERYWDDDELGLFKYMYENGHSEEELSLAFKIDNAEIQRLAKEMEIKSPRVYRENNNMFFCCKCLIYKQIFEFNKDISNAYNISDWCIKCTTEWEKQQTILNDNILYNPRYSNKTKEEVHGSKTKICKDCNKEISVDFFYWKRTGKLISVCCMDCDSIRTRKDELRRIATKGY